MSSRRASLRSYEVEATTNAGLWLQKFLLTQDKNQDSSKKSAKQTLVDEVSQIKVPAIYEHFYNEIWLKSFEKIKKHYIEINGRMIVGLGAESVLETSITLHRTYGVPYIPGSALKGLAASYAHRFMGESWNKESKDKNKKIGEAHKLMFGSQDCAGYVIFHDALYVPNSRKKNNMDLPLEPDILTVHHQKYYEGKGDAPADWDNPVPIPLLSAQGKYLLVVSANSGDAKFDEKMTNLAIQILCLALKQEGIGAKTSSGYGRAKVVSFEESNNQVASVAETNSPSSPIIPSSPQLSEEEKQARIAERNQNIYSNIEKKLLEISDFETENRKKFKAIVKDDLGKLKGDFKSKGANLVRDRVREKSKKSDAELIRDLPWFKTLNLMLGE